MRNNRCVISVLLEHLLGLLHNGNAQLVPKSLVLRAIKIAKYNCLRDAQNTFMPFCNGCLTTVPCLHIPQKKVKRNVDTTALQVCKG